MTAAGDEMVPGYQDVLRDRQPTAANRTASPAVSGGVRPNRVIIRAAFAGVLAVVAAVASWWLLGRGVRTDDFPPFLGGQSAMPITRYSGPWLTAAAAAALLSALFMLAAVFDLVRWSRAGAVRATAANSAAVNSAAVNSTQ